MCSLPVPDARERETSNSFESSFFKDSFSSFVSCVRGCSELIWIIFVLFVSGKDSFEDFIRIAFSSSGRWLISAATCPQFCLSWPRNATSSIF